VKIWKGWSQKQRVLVDQETGPPLPRKDHDLLSSANPIV
jgi:hypothetical protein